MIVKLFKPRFAPLVKNRTKKQTVRPTPKRMPKVGDAISLREWTGKPYRSKQRILGESTIRIVGEVLIDEAPTMGCFIWVDRIMLSLEAAIGFSKADGFSGLKDMAEWFKLEHGLPFKGILICWWD